MISACFVTATFLYEGDFLANSHDMLCLKQTCFVGDVLALLSLFSHIYGRLISTPFARCIGKSSPDANSALYYIL